MKIYNAGLFLKKITLLTLLLISHFAYGEVPSGSLDGFQWETGQMLAISQADTFSFEVATGSRFGHIGIIVKEENSDKTEIFVYESNADQDTKKEGVRKTPLSDFLNLAKKNSAGFPEATVVEPTAPLSLVEQTRLIQNMDEMVKKRIRYNYYHYYSDVSSTLDCSQFVHDAYKSIGRQY